MIDKEGVIREFKLKPFGSKGWMGSSQFTCSKCGRSDKFGVMFSNKGGVVYCFYEETGEPLEKYLRDCGRDDLISGEAYVNRIELGIKPLIEEVSVDIEIEEKRPPYGFKRVYYDDYLEERNFSPIQYNKLNVGITDKSISLRDYIIFVLKQKGKTVGWLARSKRSKEWHKENLKRFKANEEDLCLRYRNSTNTDFEKILGGFDDINDKTEEVWLVEGIMDYVNLCNLFDIYNQDKIRCCFTFGNKVSDYQVRLLRETKIKKVVLLYDFGTIKQSKKYSLILSKSFDVWVGEFKDENIDAGDADRDYMEKIFSNLKSYYYFYKNTL